MSLMSHHLKEPISSLYGDEAVQNTTHEAASSKLSAVNFGYFEDPWLHHFVKRPVKRAPLINRGYYCRVAAIRQSLTTFMNTFSPTTPVQIVNLGSGLDTTFLWMLQKWKNITFFDVDFPEILLRKCKLILKKPEICEIINFSESSIANEEGTELHTSFYHMLALDMRNTSALQKRMSEAGFQTDVPTLFLCECVLVYMQTQFSNRIIEWAATATENIRAMIVYEQVNPHDAFGRTMVRNLEVRGCPLIGLHEYATLTQQKHRYTQLGWHNCTTIDLNHFYDCLIDMDDRKRIEKLELFDELEEWRLIQGHYMLLAAVSIPKASQIDLTSLLQFQRLHLS